MLKIPAARLFRHAVPVACATIALWLAPVVVLAQNPIVLENQNPGTTNWQIGQPGYRVSFDDSGAIKGYASAVSVNKGNDITFYVSVNPVQTYTVDIYRVGWYQGTGGRLMQHIGPLNGIQQSACPVDAVTGLIECVWTPSYTLTVPSTWTDGTYLAVLTNSQNWQNYVMFVVRDDSRSASFLYQQSTFTYEAYNNWPADHVHGKDLYPGDSSGANTVAGDPRAVMVSFDRPYTNTGADIFLRQEVYFIHWMERMGYDVTYATDLDTHLNGVRLLAFKGYMSVGHDEYWSKEMYDAAEGARDAGVNLGFFGANPIYWQVRIQPSTTGSPNRIIVCYKDQTIDPVQGPTTAVRWRDDFLNRPEQGLVGVQYISSFYDFAVPSVTYYVTNSSHWIYSGTGLQEGDGIPGIVGYEVDSQQLDYPLPPTTNYTLLSHSPVIANDGTLNYANSSIYQAPSGAWVFASGTISWSEGLDRVGIVDPRIQQITSNLLNTFLTGAVPAFSINPPSSLVATPVSTTEVDLNWTDNSNNEDYFVLDRSLDPRFITVTPIQLPANTTSYADVGLAANTYYYRIRAVNIAGGSSGYSLTATAVMLPAAPTSLTATGVSISQINVAWVDNAANEGNFTVERSSDAVNWAVLTASVPPNTTSYSDTELSANTTYYYRVKATNVTGSSAYSNVANATTTANVVFASDAFTRTVVNGWGTADVGGNYTISGGTTANFSVNGSRGVMAIVTTGERHARLSSVAQQDITAVARAATDKLAAGGNQKPSILLRRVDSNDFYRFEMAFTPTHTIAVSIIKKIAGSDTVLATATAAGLTHAAGSYYWMKAQSQGVNPTTLNMKVWAYGATEPGAWMLSTTDSTATLQVLAPLALFSSVSGQTSNLPVTFSWDDLLAVPNIAPPAAPSALGASALSSSQISLSWTENASNEDGTYIERSTDGVTFTQVASIGQSQTTYTDSGLNPLTTYYYRVRNYNVGGVSGYSNVANATTSQPTPVAPTNLIASAYSSTEIDLSWTDNANDESSFKIERSLDGNTFSLIATVGANVTTFPNTGLTQSTVYYYRVRASNGAGDSAASNVVMVTTPGLPAPPSNLSANAVSSGEIDLSWTDNSVNEDGFRIERSTDGVIFTLVGSVGANLTTFADTTVAPSTLYYYRVHSFNSGGESAYTNVASAMTPSALAPLAPSNLSATAVSSSQINLAWTDNSNNETGFKIERSTDGVTFTQVGTVGSNVTTMSDMGLSPATIYYYRVKAYNAEGDSPYSNTANTTTPPLPPAPPSSLSASAVSSSQINLSWIDNSNNETGFKIERSPDGLNFVQIALVSANVTTYSDVGLPAATLYYYRVRGTNSGGDSAYSNVSSAMTLPPPPAAPTSLSSIAVSSSQINLNWTDNSNNETGFSIERSLDGTNFTPLNTVGANVTSYSDLGLAASTVYYYRVRAFNSGGNSGYTNIASAATLPPPPAAPTGLTATAITQSRIDLAWVNNATNQTGFNIERSLDGNNFTPLTTVGASVVTFSDTGLTTNTTYYYRVNAYNTGGVSSYSNVASATTFASTVYAFDNFSRTVASAWGSAVVGGSYTTSGGTAANFSVNGSTGITVLDTLGERQARLASVSQQDITVTARASTDKVAVGGNQKPSLLLRRVDGNNFYRFEVAFTLKGAVQVSILKRLGSVESTISTVNTALTVAPGQFFWVKARSQGINPTTLSMKVWAYGTSEPASWTLTATDSTSGLQTAAPMAIFSAVSGQTTNLPVTFSWDDLTATAQ